MQYFITFLLNALCIFTFIVYILAIYYIDKYEKVKKTPRK